MIEARLLVFFIAMFGYVLLVFVLVFLLPKMLDKPIKKDDSNGKWRG